MLSSVGPQSDRHFGDLCSKQRGFDDHFSGELHAGATLIKALVKIPAKAAHSAIHIMHRRMEPPSRHEREDWIAKPPMKKRHGSRQNLAASRRHSTSLHQIVSGLQLFQEAGDLAKVIKSE